MLRNEWNVIYSILKGFARKREGDVKIDPCHSQPSLRHSMTINETKDPDVLQHMLWYNVGKDTHATELFVELKNAISSPVHRKKDSSKMG